jgi:acyl carrier protein
MSQQRKERLVTEISDIFEEASGMELEGADRNAGFVELGLDSLFLTSGSVHADKKIRCESHFPSAERRASLH